MNENKNTFEVPSVEVITMTLNNVVGSSGRTGWETNTFKIPEISS